MNTREFSKVISVSSSFKRKSDFLLNIYGIFENDIFQLFFYIFPSFFPRLLIIPGVDCSSNDVTFLSFPFSHQVLQEKRRKQAAMSKKKKDTEDAAAPDGSVSHSSSIIMTRDDTFGKTMSSDLGDSFEQITLLEDDLDSLPFEDRMTKMFEMLLSELGSADAVYHMASRVLEEDSKAWYHMKMALSKNERIRYFVDGLRRPRFATDFLTSMFGSVVKMMDALEGALDGTIEDTRLLRLMLNSQEKTDLLLSEFGKARTLAHVMLVEIIPSTKNTHYILRDALRGYTGAVEGLANFIDNDIALTEKMLRCVMTSNIKGLLDLRPMLLTKGNISRARYESKAKMEAIDTASPFSPTDAMSQSPTDISETQAQDQPSVLQHDSEIQIQIEKKSREKDRERMRRRKHHMKRKLPPLPKFTEAAWKAHLANRLNAAIEICAETAAMKQVAVALNLNEQQAVDESTQANAQGLIMSVFESRMMVLQSICDVLGCRMSSEAVLNSALNMQRETLNAFLNSFDSKDVGLQILELLITAKNNCIDKLELSATTNDAMTWSPLEGIGKMLRFPSEFKTAMMSEVRNLKEKGIKMDTAKLLNCVDSLMTMEEETINTINDCLVENRHPLAYQSSYMNSISNFNLSSHTNDQLLGIISEHRKTLVKILASSFDSTHRTEREQKASHLLDQMISKFDKDVIMDFLQNMASRFDTMLMLHRLERDRNKVFDFVHKQGPERNLVEVNEAVDKVESLLQKAQRMTKITIRLSDESASVITFSEEGDEAALKSQIHNILKDLHRAGIEMAMVLFDDTACVDSFYKLYDAVDNMRVECGLQGFVDYMNSDEFKEITDQVALPLINEMSSTLRRMTRLASREEVRLVKKCLVLQCQRMILRTEGRHGPHLTKEFADKPEALAVYHKLKSILSRPDGKKVLLRALKEFFLTDEFKAVIEEVPLIINHLMKALDELPKSVFQTIQMAANDYKVAMKEEEKKKATEESSSHRKPKVVKPKPAEPRSFASRLPAPPPPSAPTPPAPPAAAAAPAAAVVAVPAAVVQKASSELKSGALSKAAYATSSDVKMRAAAATAVTPTPTAPTTTPRSQPSSPALDLKGKEGVEEEKPRDVSSDESAATGKKPEEESETAEEKKRAKKKKKKDESEPFYEPLKLPTLERIYSTAVKPDRKGMKAKQPQMKKPRKKGVEEGEDEDLTAQVIESSLEETIESKSEKSSKDHLRGLLRGALEEDRKMKSLKEKEAEKKKQRQLKIEMEEKKKREMKMDKDKQQPPGPSKLRPHSQIFAGSEGEDAISWDSEIDSEITETRTRQSDIIYTPDMIGDLRWLSTQAEPPVESVIKSEEVRQALSSQAMTSGAKIGSSEDDVGKEEEFVTDAEGKISLAPQTMVVPLHEKADAMPKRRSLTKKKDAEESALKLPGLGRSWRSSVYKFSIFLCSILFMLYVLLGGFSSKDCGCPIITRTKT